MVTTVIRSLFNTEPLGCGGLDNCQDLPMQVTKNADTWTKLGRSKPFIKAAQKNTKAGLRLFFLPLMPLTASYRRNLDLTCIPRNPMTMELMVLRTPSGSKGCVVRYISWKKQNKTMQFIISPTLVYSRRIVLQYVMIIPTLHVGYLYMLSPNIHLSMYPAAPPVQFG